MTTSTQDPHVAPSADAAVIAVARAKVSEARALAAAAERRAHLERNRRRQVERSLDAVLDAVHSTKVVTAGKHPGRDTFNLIKKRVDEAMDEPTGESTP
ncbi:hypothetical protein CLV30_12856 [Haloactinopolyspora alba]|uniref:Uncharacterized protein n=1 Tax=Haloactinopolyspora alba TaxID=648780 RepID=A0A2P8DF05_9ACTN|nr:hypothetical protein [Haloactinopolyspora alba]PSK95804.1 hypothetical protein CLV30_12856 [Haloactinopolyspora alba]